MSRASEAARVLFFHEFYSRRFKNGLRISTEYVARTVSIQEHMRRQKPLDFSPANDSSVFIEVQPMLAHDPQDLGEVLNGPTIKPELPARKAVVMGGLYYVDPEQLAFAAQSRGQFLSVGRSRAHRVAHLGCCGPVARQRGAPSPRLLPPTKATNCSITYCFY